MQCGQIGQIGYYTGICLLWGDGGERERGKGGGREGSEEKRMRGSRKERERQR